MSFLLKFYKDKKGILGLYDSNVLKNAFILMNNIRNLISLKFIFEENYPIEAPEVTFVGKMPDHEHIYSNGFICMSILYDCKIIRMECCNECWIGCMNTYINVSIGREKGKTFK